MASGQTGSRRRPALGNHRFTLTQEHLSHDEIQAMKHEYDERGSLALASLQSISSAGGGANSRPDLHALLRDHHSEEASLRQLWEEVQTVPEWVDWASVERGQQMFWRYGLANLIGFAMQGFMGGNAATPSIAEVLARTGGFQTSIVLRRASETFQGLLETTRSLKDLQPGGHGHISLVRVRLLHASVRQRILRLCESQPGYFDVEKYGIPINTCDDVHTIALFACNSIWLELPTMGLHPRPEEIDDYIHMFRYVACVLGVPDHFFSTSAKAKETMEAFCVHDCEPNETSQVLCHNFIAALKDVPPVNLSAGFIAAASRAINGDEMSDALGVGASTWFGVAAFRGFCWLAQSLVVIQKIFPAFDAYMIETQRRLLYAYIVEGNSSKFSLGGASRFDMKYIPRIGKRTTDQVSSLQVSTIGVLLRPLEMLFLAVFVLGWCLGLVLVYAAWTVLLNMRSSAIPASRGIA